jgi:hypothetical protein
MSSMTFIREYRDIGITTAGKVLQAGAEPGAVDQAIATSGTAAQSAAFNVDTRIVAISTPAATAIACKFGPNPTADATSLRLPADSVHLFGVQAGHKVSLLEIA